jgi:hypothetical protein
LCLRRGRYRLPDDMLMNSFGTLPVPEST